MNAVTPLLTEDGRVVLRDARFSPDEVADAAMVYEAASRAADLDFEHRRLVNHEKYSAPRRDRAGEDLHTAAAPHLSLDEAERLGWELVAMVRAERLRRRPRRGVPVFLVKALAR